MSKPITYHRHENHGPFVYYAREHDFCRKDDQVPVAVVDVREDSDDMKRVFGLWEDITGRHISDWDRGRLLSLFARFAAGESAEPPIVTFQPGQRVRRKTFPTYEYTVGRAGSYFSHITNRAWESGGSFTSEHYELVDGE